MIDKVSKSLKVKLFLLFFAMNLIGILLVGFISYQSKKDALREQVENNITVISTELADKVERYLSERQNDTKAIALHYSLYGLKTTTSSQNKILARYLKIYPYYEHINIINIEDVKLPEKDGPAGRGKAAGLATRKKGVTCGKSGVCLVGYDEGWYLPAVYGKAVSSDMFVSPLTDKATMAFAAPVKDEEGRVVSLITTNLKLEYLWDIVDQVGKDNQKGGLSGYAFILNKDGFLIAHPDKRKVLSENVLFSQDTGLRSMTLKMTQGSSGTGNYNYEGVTRMAAFAPCKGYRDYDGHGWSLAVTYPHSELYATLAPLLGKYMLIFLGTSLAMLFVSTKLADYIVKPVVALKEGASRIGSGNFRMRIETSAKDEIGDLALSFNRMAETLEARDTQIKEYTSTLTHINSELESKQEELRRANEVLMKTNKELRKLEKQKADFMAMMTHDIKSPLSTVITYSEMVLNGVISDSGQDVKKAIRSIHASGYKILSLVDNFLASSAIEVGKLQLNLKPLDVNDFVEDEIPFFTPQMEKKNIEFSLLKTAGLSPVMADKIQLDRAFSNIMSNAIKYTSPGGRITVNTLPEENGVAVSVSDTGRGIPPEEVEKLFRKYERSKEASKDEGLGLGLYISRAIVEAHGGAITVVSSPGEGSTFTIHLPFKTPPKG